MLRHHRGPTRYEKILAERTPGPSEAEPFWTDFLRSLTRRGLRGVKLVISDAHAGLKAAAAKVLGCTWQRCKVHFLRNALAYAGKGQRQMVLALIDKPKNVGPLTLLGFRVVDSSARYASSK